MGKRFLAVAVILAFSVLVAGEAFARMGGGRSSGSRGSRSMSAPSRPYAPPPATAPSPTADPYSPYPQRPAPQAPSQGGGFFRNFGAGMLGGLLGSMLGGGSGCGSRAEKPRDADPFGTGLPPKESSGGGLGFMDILLLAGLAYLVYRFFAKRRILQQRQQQPPSRQDATLDFPPPLPPVETGPSPAPFPSPTRGAAETGRAQGVAGIRRMDPSFDEKGFLDQATDLFFRLQGAWTRRELSPVRDALTAEMQGVLQADVNDMKAQGRFNRLENIAVRSVEITEAWQESGMDYVTVRFVASLLDFTTDESGRVLSGSDAVPVKFEEHWTLTRPVGPGGWKLSAIQQP